MRQSISGEIPERLLLLLAVLGGAFGALFTQCVFFSA